MFYYFGVGLWIFGKLLGRGIQRSYREHQEQQRIHAVRQNKLNRIEEENRAAGRGLARGIADVREQERIRRQNEKAEKAYWNNLNKMYEVPQVNDNFFLGDEPNNKKKKRSIFDL